jgi:transposase
MRKKRRKFSPEFKDEAVRLVRNGAKVTEVARNIGVGSGVLSAWVIQAEEREKPGALTGTEREELTRLRRENEQLRMEREILKKATAFFAKESK